MSSATQLADQTGPFSDRSCLSEFYPKPKPKTLNPKPEILTPTLNPKLYILHPKVPHAGEAPSLKPKAIDPEAPAYTGWGFGLWALGLRV